MAERKQGKSHQGSSGPNDVKDVTKKAPLEAPVPASEKFKPAEVDEDYEYVAGDGSGEKKE